MAQIDNMSINSLKKNPKVALVYGGTSKEKEVSNKSARQVNDALLALKYPVKKINADTNLVRNLKQYDPDIAFIAMHGGSGEDGTIQGLLDSLDIRYTGSGVLASALAMDKTMSKRLFLENNIKTPSFLTVREGADQNLTKRIKAEIGYPVIFKPPCQGSTIGMSVVKRESEVKDALALGFNYEKELLVEQFVKGVEITVGVLGNEKPIALPPIEITTETGFYDYKTKYTTGLSSHIFPARISKANEKIAQEAAVKAHKVLGCKGFSRADFMVPKNAEPLMLEVNTIPGLTKLSLFPDAAKAGGISFEELIKKLISLALAG